MELCAFYIFAVMGISRVKIRTWARAGHDMLHKNLRHYFPASDNLYSLHIKLYSFMLIICFSVSVSTLPWPTHSIHVTHEMHANSTQNAIKRVAN